MSKGSTVRTSLALVFALGALVVIGIAPVAAETDMGCVGTCGYYQVDDNDTGMPGARCTYANSYPYKLKEISIRPPLMHGYQADKDPVGWAFRIQRKSVNGSKWRPVFDSTYQNSSASDSIPAYLGHGFSRRTWSAPSNPNGYYWRVVLMLRWKADNGNVVGTAKVRYEWYNQIRKDGNAQNLGSGYCIASN
jgi:hypothetical protein